MEEQHEDTPDVIDLGDAADLTRGGSSGSIEDKRTPYSE
ncbi:albusnodin family lasso peptide [Nocardiopsis sp. FIRDI 009]|nr:albusnodin family lasso peptide [Nocardiopsis sp. FIRDI 009]